MSHDEERAQTPPREDLLRMSPFTVRQAGDNAGDGEAGDGLTMDGWAAVFNRKTLIDSWEGRFFEEVANGSMKKSFREKPPKIQFDHGRHPLMGSLPIARTDVAEEAVHAEYAPEGGAHIVGRLFDNWLVQPFRDAIADQAVDGMSFRFSVVREEWRDPDGKLIKDEEKLRDLLFRSWYEDLPEEELLLRTLKELKVPEAGPVVWPQYTETSVGVRSKTLTIDLGRLAERGEQRKLARAVFLADAASRTINTNNDAPPPNQGPPAGHPSPIRDAPPAPAASSGEHPSADARRRRDRFKSAAQRHAGYLLSIEERAGADAAGHPAGAVVP